MVGRREYEDEHRLFVQGIMSKGVLNKDEVNSLHEKVLKMCGIEVPEKRKELLDLLAANIAIINDELKTVGLLIRKGLDEDTGDSCFMLINTQNRMVGQNRDLGTRVQTQFSQSELDYLRLLATEILQSEEKMISSRSALNLMDKVGGGKKLTVTEAEASITKFLKARWLKTLEGSIVLDVRFLGEMENWMVDVVGGVAKCQACLKIVVRGKYCSCEDLVGWHKYCLVRQAKQGVTTKCKKCKEVIHSPTGEGGSSKRKGGEEEQMEEEEEQEGASQSQRSQEMPPPAPRSSRDRRRSGGEQEEGASQGEGSSARRKKVAEGGASNGSRRRDDGDEGSGSSQSQRSGRSRKGSREDEGAGPSQPRRSRNRIVDSSDSD